MPGSPGGAGGAGTTGRPAATQAANPPTTSPARTKPSSTSVAAARLDDSPWSQRTRTRSSRPGAYGLRQRLSGSRRHSSTVRGMWSEPGTSSAGAARTSTIRAPAGRRPRPQQARGARSSRGLPRAGRRASARVHIGSGLAVLKDGLRPFLIELAEDEDVLLGDRADIALDEEARRSVGRAAGHVRLGLQALDCAEDMRAADGRDRADGRAVDLPSQRWARIGRARAGGSGSRLICAGVEDAEAFRTSKAESATAKL